MMPTIAQKMRLRMLIRALHLEIERLEWEDADALEIDVTPDRECDGSFDYSDDSPPCSSIDDDLPDETDLGPVGPLCVECGNWYHSCVC